MIFYCGVFTVHLKNGKETVTCIVRNMTETWDKTQLEDKTSGQQISLTE